MGLAFAAARALASTGMATQRILGAGDDIEKCVRCSRAVAAVDRVVMMHGDLFHGTCWTLLSSEVRRADSRQLAKLSTELIKRSREKLRARPTTPTSASN